jgi:transposase InsO family protein
MDDKTKQDIGLLRIAILGELVGAEREHGDLRNRCLEAAEKRWIWPDGTPDEVKARTVENWYYAFKKGGFAALLPRDRSDLGSSDIRPELADLLVRAKRERPRRSLRRLIKMMLRAKRAAPGELTRSSVHRLLAHHNVSGRPKRGPSAERRSFLHEFAGELLIGDALHPRRKVIVPSGGLRKAYMLSQIDCATRYVPESFFAFHEDAPDQEKGLKQVLLTHGRWHRYYVDRGSAYIARSLRIICAELDMGLLHTGPGDAEAKAAIERWHRTWREEVEDELPDHPIPLSELEAKHRAWLSCEYHARKHDTTQRIPREHFIEQCHHLRPLLASHDLDQIFLHRAERTVSKVGTVRWGGDRLEVSPELSERVVELRYDPSAPDKLPKVFVENRFVCDTVPLDLYKNAHRKRRRDLGAPDPKVEPTGIDPLGDMVREHQRFAQPLCFLAEKETADEGDSTEK